jgi:hypothetical protein
MSSCAYNSCWDADIFDGDIEVIIQGKASLSLEKQSSLSVEGDGISS